MPSLDQLTLQKWASQRAANKAAYYADRTARGGVTLACCPGIPATYLPSTSGWGTPGPRAGHKGVLVHVETLFATIRFKDGEEHKSLAAEFKTPFEGEWDRDFLRLRALMLLLREDHEQLEPLLDSLERPRTGWGQPNGRDGVRIIYTASTGDLELAACGLDAGTLVRVRREKRRGPSGLGILLEPPKGRYSDGLVRFWDGTEGRVYSDNIQGLWRKPGGLRVTLRTLRAGPEAIREQWGDLAAELVVFNRT